MLTWAPKISRTLLNMTCRTPKLLKCQGTCRIPAIALIRHIQWQFQKRPCQGPLRSHGQHARPKVAGCLPRRRPEAGRRCARLRGSHAGEEVRQLGAKTSTHLKRQHDQPTVGILENNDACASIFCRRNASTKASVTAPGRRAGGRAPHLPCAGQPPARPLMKRPQPAAQRWEPWNRLDIPSCRRKRPRNNKKNIHA